MADDRADEPGKKKPSSSEPEELQDAPTVSLPPRREVGEGRPGPPKRRAGEKVADKYELVDLISDQGAFGEVWLARRLAPYQRIAIKFIRPDRVDPETLRRFEEVEPQALARLNHDYIARFHDVGRTEDGTPFLAMEYVPGEPVTTYCNRRKLPIPERVELLAKVCEAVHHMHMQGVIHRDLKPANILVTETADKDGVRAVPKLVDFGLARSVNPNDPIASQVVTQFDLFAGTYVYASPEQVAGRRAEDVDSKTDVYALGAVLFELLVGVTPMHGAVSDPAKSAPERQMALATTERPTPAEALAALPAATGERVAANRRLSPAALERLLRSRLRHVVGKALRMDPRKRFSDAATMQRDLHNYLAGTDFLEAAAEPRRERFVRHVRRHRVSYAATVLVFLALVGGILATTWQAVQATRAKEAERAARERAEQRERDLAQVVEFQATMLRDVDPESMGRSLVGDMRQRLDATLAAEGLAAAEIASRVEAFDAAVERVSPTDVARRLLDVAILAKAVDAIDRQLADQPLVEAALRQTVGDVYETLGMYAAALAQSERALAIRLSELGEDHRDTLSSRNNLGTLLGKMDRPEEAEEHISAALTGFRRLGGADEPEALTAAGNLASVLRRLNRLEEAETYYREALDGYQRIAGPDDRGTLTALSNMGSLLQLTGRWQEAEEHFVRALEGRRRALGEEDPDTLVSYTNVGLILWAQYRLDEAEAYLESAHRLARRLHGEDHPVTIQALMHVGLAAHARGRYVEAETAFSQALALSRRTLGDRHYDTLTCLANLAAAVEAQGRLAEAERHYREALAGLRATAGEGDRYTLVQMSNLALLLAERGRLDEADRLLREAVERGLRTLGEVDDVLIWMNNHAGVLRDLERLDEAAGLGERAVTAARASLPPPYLGRFLTSYGRTLHALDRHAEAADAMEEAHEIIAAALGADSDWALEAARHLVEFYTTWHGAEPDGGHDLRAAAWRDRLEGQPVAEVR